MTFSICVRERYLDDEGTDRVRFGVAVTTRVPCVGARVPFVSEHGAIATQSVVNPRLGRRGIEYLADGLSIEDALAALLNADEGAARRQVHGVDATGTFVHSGSGCDGWYGHEAGENYTVAGNHLAGEAVVRETARAYEASDRTTPLSARLIEALAAGYEEGGDDRVEQLPVQSGAVRIASTERFPKPPADHDLRVDATERPVERLRETCREARRGHELFLAHIGQD